MPTSSPRFPAVLLLPALLAGASALAQMPPANRSGGTDTRPANADTRAQCTAEAKRSNLSGRELDDYVKQCVSRAGHGSSGNTGNSGSGTGTGGRPGDTN